MNWTKMIKPMPLLMMIAGALVVFGCSKSGTVPTQLAAKMGSDEVTLYEVDRAMARLPATPASNVAAVRKSVLDELIDRRLMADQAVKLKLDRTPNTVADVESCRLSTLQSAYVMSIAARPSDNAPSEKRDAQNYYEHHPEFFSDRKIYRIKEIAFPESAGLSAAQAEKLSPSDLLALLEQRGVNYRSMFGPVPAEDLPPEVLGTVLSLEDGRSKVLKISGNVLVISRLSASSTPLDLQAAEPRIREYLGLREADERVHAQLALLRSQAGVRYMNEFASTPVAPDASHARASATAVDLVKQ
jgi:peptidyl-prolyl cis-trans isomerase C